MNNSEIEICHRIKALRKEIGLNQTDFGKKIEVAQGYLTNIETAKRPATEKIIKLICLQDWDGKKVSKEWLLHGSGEMFVKIDKENQLMMWAATVLKDESDSFKRRFVNMLMSLDESDWETIEKIATNLNKNS